MSIFGGGRTQSTLDDVKAVHTAIAFLVSAVRCGTNWDDECERIKTEGFEALMRLADKARMAQ